MLFLPLQFAGILLVYLFSTLIYSFYLKRQLIIDVFTLAALYTLRIIAGGLAIGVAVSSWLLALSMFGFISLAFLKRYIELLALQDTSGSAQIKNRGYHTDDIEMVNSFGTISGYLSVLVFALYLSTDAQKTFYSSPFLLWLICPVLLYWVTRVWFLAHRGGMLDDPVQFALTDKVSLFTVVLVMGLALGARFV